MRLDIDDRDVIRMFIGHVGGLVVMRDRQPTRTLPAKSGTSQQRQVRQRVRIEGAVHPAVDQQCLLIRSDGNAMRYSGASDRVLLCGGYIGKLDEWAHARAAKSKTAKSIEATILSVYLIGRAVGFLRYRHWRGGRIIGTVRAISLVLRVDHVHRVGRPAFDAAAGPSEHVLAVRGDVQVVDAAPDRDGLDVLQARQCR